MKEGRSETERMKEEGKKRGREAGGDICQQFVVEFELVSVNTDAVLGEASRDARLPAHSKMIPIIRLHLTISMLFLWDRPKA